MYAHILAFIALLIAAIAFRFHDINWDQSQLLHPDERYVGVLTSQLTPPASIAEFFDSGTSTFNPLNTEWGRSYVYGTLPLFVGRWVGGWLDTGCGDKGLALPKLVGQAVFGNDAKDCFAGEFLGFNLMTLVGRAISAIYDVITVIVVYLIGRRLFGWRVGLLAMGLSAITVLQIQQAHYFTVDAAAAMFSTLTIYFCARIVTMQVHSRRNATALIVNSVLAGVMAGMAIACKISVWPLAGIITLCIVIALLRDRRRTLRVVLDAWLALMLAGVFTFVSFRVVQPYAFVGPSATEWAITLGKCDAFPADSPQQKNCAGIKPLPESILKPLRALPAPVRAVLAPSSRWIASLDLAQGFVNGTIDAPFGIQWADRTPILFPLVNLVFYGMGIALSLAAILGFFWSLRQLMRGVRWWAYAPIVLWTGAYFLYQSTQWTKSIRYLLPIYPELVVLAAVGLMALWRASRSRGTIGRVSPAVAYGTIAIVIGGTLVWTLAFMQIYAGEITRVQASRWIYQNVPTAATMSWREGNTDRHLQLPVPEIVVRSGDAPAAVTVRLNNAADAIKQPITSPRVQLNHLRGSGDAQVRLVDVATNTELQVLNQNISADAAELVFDKATLQPGAEYYLEFSLPQPNQGFTALTSKVANEHWDDGLPQGLDGRDAFGSYYRGLTSSGDGQIQNYNNENEEKRAALLNWLDEADYLVLSSNRLYGSIPRLPWRFPMAVAYYKALLGGQMGFELVADFNSFPRIGPFKFNDQEMPQTLVRAANTGGTAPGVEVPYPTAEEAFSVYDHPRVLIFRKTTYTRELGESLFGVYDLSRVINQTTLDAQTTPMGMLLSQKTLDTQAVGGTWSELFPRNSPLNQSQFLAVLAWVALVEVLGIAAFMLMAVATRRSGPDSRPTLIDGGYAFSKMLGILLVSVSAWWLGSAKLVQFTPMALWCIVGVLAVAAAIIGHLNRDAILALVKARWPVFVAAEIVFLAGFVFFLLVRAGNPDLWHPYFGGEKPMDFAYFNAVLKATWFPPQDVWFAGGAINYYYFGFVMVGAPVKALGIDPAVAYNIVLPTLFALLASGAFGLGASFYAAAFLQEKKRKEEAEGTEAWRGGKAEEQRSGGEEEKGRLGDREDGVTFAAEVRDMSAQASLDPVVDPVVDAATQPLIQPANLTTEQPVIATPVRPFTPSSPSPRLRSAILAGVIAAIFVAVIGNLDQIRVVGPGLQQLGGATPDGFAPVAFVVGLVKWLGGAQLPIAPWWPYWNPTRLSPEVMIAEFPQFTFLYADLHAHMMAMPLALLALAFALAFAGGARRWPAVVLGAIATGMLWPSNTWDYPPYVLLGVAGLGLGAFALAGDDQPWTLGRIISKLAQSLPVIIVFGVLTRAAMSPYLATYGSAYNSIDPWHGTRTTLDTYIIIYGLFLIPLAVLLLWQLFSDNGATRRRMQIALALGIVVGGILLVMGVPVGVIGAPMALLALGAAILPAQTQSNQTRLLWLMTAGAWAITLFVELFVLRGDIERMNTQFKFYIQAWLMLGVASAVALVWLMERLFARRTTTTTITTDEGIQTLTTVRRTPAVVRGVFAAVIAVAFALAALYPVFAVPAKVEDRYVKTAPRGLDGMAYMQYAIRDEEYNGRRAQWALKDDYDAIKWMQDNVKGSPTIIEEGAAMGNQYRWSARFSIYTGLPDVVGWQWHQQQQRAALSMQVVTDRVDDVHAFYSTPGVDYARALLRRYDVRYIIVGAMEKLYNEPAGFAKFTDMVESGDLRVAYQNPGVTIYEVIRR